jgi:hypothetical protein
MPKYYSTKYQYIYQRIVVSMSGHYKHLTTAMAAYVRGKRSSVFKMSTGRVMKYQNEKQGIKIVFTISAIF